MIDLVSLRLRFPGMISMRILFSAFLSRTSGMMSVVLSAALFSGCYPKVDKAECDSGFVWDEVDGWCKHPDGTGTEACVDDPDCDGDGDGFTQNDGDCDDGHAWWNPDAEEVCDGEDNDCDGDIDEGVMEAYYLDADDDGYGDATETTMACEATDEYVASPDDCDDDDPLSYPGANEYCNGTDNNCDGVLDNSPIDAQEWFPDDDADGFGDETAIAELACEAPTGHVSNDTDCDDDDETINPYAIEVCDDANVDEDCNGVADDADANVDPDSMLSWWVDNDGDGYGHVSGATTACEEPSGFVQNYTDCDDTDANINPMAREECDGLGVDENCDGITDASRTWYADSDGDSFGDAAVTEEDCDTPTGYVADDTDCDDTEATTNPAATEYCDLVDNDCDGTTDESDAADAVIWYGDADADGYGDPSTGTYSCSEPSGYTDNDDDCDDSDAAISPDATEECDGADVDEDCNGSADDADSGVDTSTQTTWYADSDSDGYGDLSSTTDACDEPSGYVADNSDCDDADSGVNPSATEVCDGSDVDEDCDGDVDDDDSDVDTSTYNTFYADSDADGYGDASSTTDACDEPSGYVTDDTDCDDTDVDINPIATEVCDSADNDCDGDVDDDDSSVDSSTFTDWYPDSDSDGFGDSTASATAQCASPSGYVDNNTDCDDTDASSTTDTWYADTDGDGFGDASSTQSTCTQPSGYVSDDQDCDDTDSGVSPDGVELYFDLSTGTETDNCDGVDSDCDGDIDEGCTDDDGDGTADGAQLLFACDADSDGVENSFCFPDSFTSPWAGEDCMYTLSPFTSITTAAAKTPVTVTFGGNTYTDTCYINGGGSVGDLYVSAVSAIGADGSTAVDTTDTSDWIYADFGWCDYYGSSSTYCYGSSTLPSGWGAQIYWDGTEVTVP